MNKRLLSIITAITLFTAYLSLTSSSGGISGVATSGCSCHGAANTATMVSVTGFPANYANGVAYPITITVTNPSMVEAGFTLTVSNGTLSAGSVGTVISGLEIRHNTPKTLVAGSASWTFMWTAPMTGSSSNTAAAAGNAVNNNNGTSGDAWNFAPTLTIPGPTASPLSLTASNTAITCNGGLSMITAAAAGGNAPYQYRLNTGTYQASNLFMNNLSGTYTVTVRDATLIATSSTVITIGQPTVIAISINSSTSVSCAGGNNGTASVAPATGGTGAKTYNWTPGNPTGDGTVAVSGLTAGTWTCTATDANGCTKTTTTTITAPMAITAPITATPVSCFGGANGSATVTTIGGTGAYTYAWTPTGGTSATASGLAAGSYTCTITDANLCVTATNITITQPAAALASTISSTNVSCFGGNNGSATVATIGGTGTYTYAWSPSGGTSATASGLAAGSYTCTITDANLCVTATSISITQPTTAVSATISATNVSCMGGANGSATVTPSGGTGAYTYAWSPSGGTAATATGLAAGAYTCTITDANLCVTATSISITQPTTAVSATISATNATCVPGNDGSAMVAASGGSGSYTYSWLPSGGTSSMANGLAVGSYTCTITDANMCATNVSTTIGLPTPIVVIANVSATNLCVGNTLVLTGSNTASVPSLLYTWSGGITNGIEFVANASTTYTVSTTDANGCAYSSSTAITVNTINNLAQASIGNTASMVGTTCNTMAQVNGANNNYTNASCNLLASVLDSTGGNALGDITTCVEVMPSIIEYNDQPFAARVYNITPQNPGAATISLYYTTDDIIDYNAHINAGNSGFPLMLMPTNPPVNGDVISNTTITKVSGTTPTAIPTNLVYDAANNYWVGTFVVSSFSTFYLHTTNPNNTPLNINLINFSGAIINNVHSLIWDLENEAEIINFELQHSTNGSDYTTLVTKLVNGSNKYTASNSKYAAGNNYYRLKTNASNNKISYSKTIVLASDNSGKITLYPNPATKLLNYSFQDMNKVIAYQIIDAVGKLVAESKAEQGTISQTIDVSKLAKGIYSIKLIGNASAIAQQQFVVQ